MGGGIRIARGWAIALGILSVLGGGIAGIVLAIRKVTLCFVADGGPVCRESHPYLGIGLGTLIAGAVQGILFFVVSEICNHLSQQSVLLAALIPDEEPA